jgi:hypothetical protein
MESFSQNLTIQAFSAFSGAFFAFLFLRLAEFFSKIYERQVKHYNSLVTLETQLIEIGGIVHDSLYEIDGFTKAIQNNNVCFNTLKKIPVDKSHYANFYDLTIKNILFSHNYQIRKINDDAENMMNGYKDIKNALIQKNISLEDYKINANMIAESLKIFKLFLADFMDKNNDLIARVRVQTRYDKPLGSKIIGKFIRSKGSELNKAEIAKEKEKLNQEANETMKKSADEIEKTLKK